MTPGPAFTSSPDGADGVVLHFHDRAAASTLMSAIWHLADTGYGAHSFWTQLYTSLHQGKEAPRPNIIGILGGNGPDAALRCASIIVEAARADGAAHDAEFPQIVIRNIAVPGLTMEGLTDPEVARPSVELSLRQLVAAGATVIGVACNSLYPLLAGVDCGVAVLDLPELLADAVAAGGHRRVAVLCSDTARAAGIHSRALARRGIETVEVGEDWGSVTSAIADAVGRTGGADLGALIGAAEAAGADAVVLGCTDLAAPPGARLPVIDSIAVLASGLRMYRNL